MSKKLNLVTIIFIFTILLTGNVFSSELLIDGADALKFQSAIANSNSSLLEDQERPQPQLSLEDVKKFNLKMIDRINTASNIPNSKDSQKAKYKLMSELDSMMFTLSEQMDTAFSEQAKIAYELYTIVWLSVQ